MMVRHEQHSSLIWDCVKDTRWWQVATVKWPWVWIISKIPGIRVLTAIWRRYKSNSGNISATNFPFLQIGHSRNLFNNWPCVFWWGKLFYTWLIRRRLGFSILELMDVSDSSDFSRFCDSVWPMISKYILSHEPLNTDFSVISDDGLLHKISMLSPQ